jgi:pimeloyl-ACP methyl ester carboxylesterase
MELKQLETPELSIAYLEMGETSGAPLVMVHGWPDDVTAFSGVAARLKGAGLRILAPYLRGFGPTRFKTTAAMRSGQLSALADDLDKFISALGLGPVTLLGHDWGARACYIFAALHPARVRALLALSVGYGTNDPAQSISYAQAKNYWYHWFFATARGAAALSSDRRGLAEFLWRAWAPRWRFSAAELEQAASSWDNPDWVAITLHSYRHRWGFAAGDPRYDGLERQLASPPMITVPTIVLHGTEDGATMPETSAGKEHFFTARYERRLIECGHFIPREAPDEVVRAIRGLLS